MVKAPFCGLARLISPPMWRSSTAGGGARLPARPDAAIILVREPAGF